MNTWYKSVWMKGILCVLVSFSVVAMAVCGSLILSSIGDNITWNDIMKNKTQKYEQSESFIQTMNSSEFEIISQIYNAASFETNGVYDGDKLVDIKELYDNGNISGKNISGFAYTINQLVNWYDESNSDSSDHLYVVCKKPDKTYYYCEFSKFKQMVTDEKYKFNLSDNLDFSTADILSRLENEGSFDEYTNNLSVLDEKNQLIFTDCWTLYSPLVQSYSPDGYSSLLDLANNNSDWNGRLSDMLTELDESLTQISDSYYDYKNPSANYSEGNSNLAYILVDKEHKRLYTNRTAYADYDKATVNMDSIKNLGAYVIIGPTLKSFESNLNTAASNWRQDSIVVDGNTETKDFIFAIGVDTAFPIQDTFYANNKEYETFVPYYIPLLIAAAIAFVVMLCALVWLTIVAGRHTDDNRMHLTGFDRVWTELAAAIVVLLWFLPCLGILYLLDSYHLGDITLTSSSRVGVATMISIVAIALLSAACFLIGWLSVIRRAKTHTLWKNSILRKLCHVICRMFKALAKFLSDFWENRKRTTKTAILCIALLLLHLFAAATGSWSVWPVFLVFIVDMAATIYLIRKMIIREQLKAGIREISQGNVSYRINAKHLKGNDLEVATLINNIGNGLHAAVDQSMKDERMKADLITNVSHDIKTPLTSIINYVDLLKRENFTDPKVVGYLEILEQKSQRLKTLTEDVVEASKVSSGNVNLEMMNINLVEMLNQIEGEFIEKFESRNLNVVMTKPDIPVIIYADGRRLSRILENIYGNAYKYAMEGTRIYADLKFVGNKAEFSLKNISAQALNISADELTERFIRGDVARTTEGSGLGLSIAKSLTELQGGTFQLYLDGDLFKVTIMFPIGQGDGSPG